MYKPHLSFLDEGSSIFIVLLIAKIRLVTLVYYKILIEGSYRLKIGFLEKEIY